MVQQWNGNGKYRCTETERQRNGNFSMPPTVAELKTAKQVSRSSTHLPDNSVHTIGEEN